MNPSSSPDTQSTRPAESSPSGAPETRTPNTQKTVTELTASRRVRGSYRVSAQLQGLIMVTALLLVVTLILGSVVMIGGRKIWFDPVSHKPDSVPSGGVIGGEATHPFADGAVGNAQLPWSPQAVAIPKDRINAGFAALADLSSGQIVASRKADERIYPASMTKIMTLIVVVENLPDEQALNTKITISQSVYDAMKKAGSSGVGMEAGEVLSVESLLYALMLKSDGIAACELARYIAGTEEDFVELMNLKAQKIGLVNTHFVNPTGLHDPNHYSTSREIASLMAYAMGMNLCRRVMLTQSFDAESTLPSGKVIHYNLYHNLIVTMFDKYKPNQPKTVTVLAGKTGFTDESRFCLVTYAETADGHRYVCVTAKGESYQACIQDYMTIYNTYVK